MARSAVKWRTTISKIFAVLVAVFYGISQSGWDQHCPTVGMILLTAGIFLVAIGTLGRLWCSLYIAGHKTKNLITAGPYSISRNPLYFFSFLGAIGVGLATETFAIPLLILVVFAMYYPFIIVSEEKKLRSKYESAYNDYFNSVPRFFPRLSLLNELKEFTVDPIVFRKHIFSAIWFFLLVGIIQLIDSMHDIGYIKSFFTIY